MTLSKMDDFVKNIKFCNLHSSAKLLQKHLLFLNAPLQICFII